MGKNKGSFIRGLQVDITKSPESWILLLINLVYFIFFFWPTFYTVNKPGCDVEIVGYVVIFRLLLNIAFLVFALRLRHINYENKGNAKWVVALSLFAMVVTVCTGFGMGWLVLIEFAATLPMLLFAIFIIIKYRKSVKDY